MCNITLAKTAGFCFGVDRAIKLIEKLLSEGKKVATLGPIIHNPQVIEDFKKLCEFYKVSADELLELKISDK